MPVLPANAPVSWGVMEVDDWIPPLDYTTFLDEVARAGYQGTELGPYGYMPPDPQELREELNRRSLALVSGLIPLSLKDKDMDLEPVQAVAKVLKAMGAGYLVLADALWPEREAVAGRVNRDTVHLTEKQWRIVARNTGVVCEEADACGLHCAFHHRAGTYVETPDEISRLLELVDVGLCLDTGHYVYGGGDPVNAVREFGTRLEYLHLSDINPDRLKAVRERGLGFLDGVRAGVFCEIGKGCVRFPELLAELDRIGYDGWAVVEQDTDLSRGCDATPFVSALASREYLRNKLGI